MALADFPFSVIFVHSIIFLIFVKRLCYDKCKLPGIVWRHGHYHSVGGVTADRLRLFRWCSERYRLPLVTEIVEKTCLASPFSSYLLAGWSWPPVDFWRKTLRNINSWVPTCLRLHLPLCVNGSLTDVIPTTNDHELVPCPFLPASFLTLKKSGLTNFLWG